LDLGPIGGGRETSNRNLKFEGRNLKPMNAKFEKQKTSIALNVQAFCKALKAKMLDAASGFGKQYLRLLVDEIQVWQRKVVIRGTHASLAQAAMNQKMGTSSKVPTFWPNWLPGRDSNPRPIGYKCPDISARLGLYHHPLASGCRALWRFIGWGPQPLVSARSCLLIPLRQASLRITIEENGISSLGFPEFTRFFIPPRGGKLQLS